MSHVRRAEAKSVTSIGWTTIDYYDIVDALILRENDYSESLSCTANRDLGGLSSNNVRRHGNQLPSILFSSRDKPQRDVRAPYIKGVGSGNLPAKGRVLVHEVAVRVVLKYIAGAVKPRTAPVNSPLVRG